MTEGKISIPKVPKLGFFNVKGGTGKSTIAARTAMKMANAGMTVGLIDMDIQSPDLDLILGMEDKTYKDVAEFMDADFLYPFTPKGYDNLHVFSMGFFLRKGLSMLLDEERILESVHDLFVKIGWPKDLQIFLLDMPPQTSRINIKISQDIMNSETGDGIAIVTTPREESQWDALRALDMLQYYNVKVIGFILNMAYHVCADCGHREWNGNSLEEVEKNLGIRPISVVPFTTQIEDFLDTKLMLFKMGITEG